mmetsp:Transcript_20722/g.51417  ORF Transcript_20722/g.51417 Transcript_20722/m.51417 type:complete len:219 (-) Transcript_20722:388-1044(-)
MSEQKNNIFSNLRDKHGVADLLQEVSKRKNALTRKKRREVQEEPLEPTVSEESSESNDNDTSQKSVGPRWGRDFLQKFNNQQQQAPQTRDESNEQRNPREFFRKFNIQRIQNPLVKTRQEQQSETANGENDRRQEIKERLERSKQQGQEMLQKFSTNFQTFSADVKTRFAVPSNAEKAARVSQSLCQLDKEKDQSVLDKASNHSALDKASNHTASSFN